MSKKKRRTKAPGQSHREGVTLVQLMDMFPDEETAAKWFEDSVWGDQRCCGHCGSTNTARANHPTMPYWCPDCRRYFSVRTGTAIARSNVPLRKWAIAIYLYLTNLKSVSSMKLHRDLGVTQKTAWFMLHRLREASAKETGIRFEGPIEVDESYFGGKRKNMHASKRKTLDGRGATGKTAVVGMKDRSTNKVKAQVVRRTDSDTLVGFIVEHADPYADVHTDESKAYQRIPFRHHHYTVAHSLGQFVDGMAHINGMESFWSTIKRAYQGTFHKISPKHLNRYVQEFTGKHNIRDQDTLDQMRAMVAGLVGRNLLYRELTADNGLDSGARS